MIAFTRVTEEELSSLIFAFFPLVTLVTEDHHTFSVTQKNQLNIIFVKISHVRTLLVRNNLTM